MLANCTQRYLKGEDNNKWLLGRLFWKEWELESSTLDEEKDMIRIEIEYLKVLIDNNKKKIEPVVFKKKVNNKVKKINKKMALKPFELKINKPRTKRRRTLKKDD